ncbi:MAG: heme-binding domain-containing protein [Chloroflexota bacterium]
MRRWLGGGLLVILAGFGAIQLVPYGHDHANPPVGAEPAWDSQTTRDLAVRACFDCHSNQTEWPWYSNVAPVSWLVQRHVNEGRQKLDFSTWGTGRQDTEHLVSVVRRGSMPTGDYLLMHPGARLTGAEQQALIDGLTKTFGAGEGGGGEGSEGGEGGEGDGEGDN